MSKIIYHKNCRQHEVVAKAKRMLVKIDKQFGGFQGTFYGKFQLTGINEIDRREVKGYIEQHLKKLKREIDKQLLRNEKLVNGEWNEDYEEGFCTAPFAEELQIVEALNEVHSFIYREYPDIETKKSDEFVFTTDCPTGKFEEANRHFRSNPIVGFLQETFGVFENGVSRKLYPLTFSKYDLQNAKAVYVQYV